MLHRLRCVSILCCGFLAFFAPFGAVCRGFSRSFSVWCMLSAGSVVIAGFFYDFALDVLMRKRCFGYMMIVRGGYVSY